MPSGSHRRPRLRSDVSKLWFAHFPKSLCINAVHIIFQFTHIIFPVCRESHHFFEFRCFTSFFKIRLLHSFSWFRFMSSFLLNFLQKIADSNVVNFDWIGNVDEFGIKKNDLHRQRIGIRHCQQYELRPCRTGTPDPPDRPDEAQERVRSFAWSVRVGCACCVES